MTKNVGSLDKTVRLIAGLGILVWGVFNQNWLGAIGLVLIATAYFGVCPAYMPLGMSTARRESD